MSEEPDFTSSNSLFNQKPLGTYACGGRCTADGFTSDDFSFRTPCPKCRVFAVTPGDLYEHGNGILVRARTGLEAVQIFDKNGSTALKVSVRLFNHDRTKRSSTARYQRANVLSATPWKRVLSRQTPEEAARSVVYRVLQTAKVAVRDWKLPPVTVAAAVEIGLQRFMEENGLQKKSKADR